MTQTQGRWPAFPPRHYLGQLNPGFQSELRAARAGVGIEDGAWYHTVELKDGTVVPGAWDLRGREGPYFGGVSVAGKRVLELGPASGYLTVYMARLGAEVVSFEAGFDLPNDVVPYRGADMRHEEMKLMTFVDRVHNSWWYYVGDADVPATMVYANIYEMPGDLGTFDISVFGCILLHLRDPWTAVREAAMRTTSTLIITDLLEPGMDLESNVMRFAPLSESEVTNWWSISPGAVVAMCKRLGFSDVTVTTHHQKHQMGHDLGADVTEMELFTVVGNKP